MIWIANQQGILINEYRLSLLKGYAMLLLI